MTPPETPLSCSRRAALRGGLIGLGAMVSGCATTDPGSVSSKSPATTDMKDTSSDPSVTTVERADGVSVRWQTYLGKRIPRPAIGPDGVYAVSSESGIHALAAADGTQQWQHSTPAASWLGPAVGAGLVAAVDYQTLVAFDAATGEERWRHTWPTEGTMSSMPIIGEDMLYVGNSSIPTSHTESQYPEDLFAFDVHDGSVQWKRNLARHDPLSGPPILHDGTLYVQTEQAGVFALDPADGRERWHVSLSEEHDNALGGPTLVAETETLVAGASGAAYGLALPDGRERWRTPGIQTAPVSDGTTVYAGEAVGSSKTAVYALAASDGSKQWRFTRPGQLTRWTSLTAAAGTLFASFRERTGERGIATLYAVSAEGDERWRFTQSCEGFSRVAVAADTVFAAGRLGDGTLYALEPTTKQ